MILLLGLLACGGGEAPPLKEAAVAAAPVVGAPSELLTRAGRYRIVWSTAPVPLPLSELFVIKARVTDADGAPVSGVTLTVDASMPQHGHGMATRPETNEVGPGEFETKGMKFHMPGAWTVHFAVSGPRGTDRVDVVVEA